MLESSPPQPFIHKTLPENSALFEQIRRVVNNNIALLKTNAELLI